MNNVDLARRFEQLASLSEINEENPFRVRAYRNLARTLLELEEQVADLVERGADLTEISGVGKDLAGKLDALVRTGELEQLSALLHTVPAGLLHVVNIQGVGPKKAARLWRELNVTSVDDLERAAGDGKVAQLAGFGAKSQEKILRGIETFRRHAGRTNLNAADAAIAPLVALLRGVPGMRTLEVAGSYRRRRETIGDVDLLAVADDAEAAGAALAGFGGVAEVLGRGPTKTSVRLSTDLQVDLRVVGEGSFGAALMYFTGSKEHNVALRQRATERGLRLNEYGLYATDGAGEVGERVAGASEDEVYAALGLDPIAPELREARGEIAAAAEHRLPRLLSEGDIRGDLHTHSTWSDGKDSWQEMRRACAERGYAYLALTDHSQALRMTGGLDGAKLERQWRELDDASLSSDGGPALLRGLEVDILKDGTLDLDDDWLERLDIVIVSVHSHFGLSRAEQTARVVRAVSHPQVNVLGHPTGRLLGERDPYDLDLDAVFEACAANRVAVEHNASPERLDLKDSDLIAARRHGLEIAVDTDAHAVRHLANLRFGVSQARRAWLTDEHVINTWPLERLRDFLAKS